MENPELEYKKDKSHGHREFWERIMNEVREEIAQEEKSSEEAK